MAGATNRGSVVGSPVLWAATAIAAYVVVLALTDGAHLGADGAAYAASGEELRSGWTFGPVAGFEAAHFPPGMALVLAPLLAAGLSPAAAGLAINACSWMATLVGSDVLFRMCGGRRGVAHALVLAWIATGAALVLLQRSLLAESLFLALSVWGLVVAGRWASTGSWPDGLATWALLTSATAVRYVGVCLAVAVAGTLLLHGGWTRRGLIRAGVATSSVLPTAVWYLRHHTAARSDAPSVSGAAVQWSDLGHSLGALGSVPTGLPYSVDETILHESIDGVLRIGLGLLGLAMLGVLLLWALSSVWRHRRSPAAWLRALPFGTVAASTHFVLSTVFLIAYRVSSGYTVLERYWLVPVVPLVVATAPTSWAGPAERARRPVLAVGALVLTANAAIAVVLVLRAQP